MKPELKHLIGYLPYSLNLLMETTKWFRPEGDLVVVFKGVLDGGEYISYQYNKPNEQSTGNFAHENFKPILRPISDLDKLLNIDGEEFIPLDELIKACDCEADREWLEHVEDYTSDFHQVNYEHAPYWFVEKLYEWHFDVHKLISQGKAVNYNEVILNGSGKKEE